jgi:hypothetical protein
VKCLRDFHFLKAPPLVPWMKVRCEFDLYLWNPDPYLLYFNSFIPTNCWRFQNIILLCIRIHSRLIEIVFLCILWHRFPYCWLLSNFSK